MTSIVAANGATWESGESSATVTLETNSNVTVVPGFLPANSTIIALAVRVTTDLALMFDSTVLIGDLNAPDRFLSSPAINSPDVLRSVPDSAIGLRHVGTPGASQHNAGDLYITLEETPSGGGFVITVFYERFQAPTA